MIEGVLKQAATVLPRGAAAPASTVSHHKSRPDGFTLIELLVVIAVISILAALLLPTLNQAKWKATLTVGMNNLRQVGLGTHMYRSDYNDFLPQVTNYTASGSELLLPYCTSNAVFGKYSRQVAPGFYWRPAYGIETPLNSIMSNFNLMGGNITGGVSYGHPIRETINTGKTFLMAHNFDTATWSPSHFEFVFSGIYDVYWFRPYQGKGTMFYFVDDHIEFLPYLGPGLSRWNKLHSGPTLGWTYSSYEIWGP